MPYVLAGFVGLAELLPVSGGLPSLPGGDHQLPLTLNGVGRMTSQAGQTVFTITAVCWCARDVTRMDSASALT